MMIALLIGVAAAQGPSVAEYFPLKPGITWTYQEVGGITTNVYTDKVGEPIDIEGKPASPIISSLRGKQIGSTYYRIEDNTVFIVAYNPKKPLSTPQPVMKLGAARLKWEYAGDSVFLNEAIGLVMKAESGLAGKRPVMGIETSVVEIKLSGVLGENPELALKVDQVAYYAKGIGLVEMLSENRLGTRTSKTQLKLVKFEPAPGD